MLSVLRRTSVRLVLTGLLLLAMSSVVLAQDGVISNGELAYSIDNLILFISAVLVLFMQAGFAMVEAGFNSAKNTVNVLFKNFIDLCAGAILFWVVGYGLMYPGEGNGFFGFGGFGISSVLDGTPGPGVLNPQVDWLFQVAFAATAATIVSGAVAGRMKFQGYLVYSVIITAIIYPLSGYWTWGGGWLSAMGFHDFAGSLIVHSVGGFAALAGIIVLGPRIGRFDGDQNHLRPHNLTIAMLGVMILWIGWYGFNPGSQLAFAGAANTDATMLIAVNTTLAAAAGGLLAMALGWIMGGKPDIGYTLNGGLAGLVGITANCDAVTNVEAIIIGAIAGVLLVLGTLLLERLKLDDVVGAVPVHGICGVWGGIAAGIFGGYPIMTQVVGSVVIPVWAFVTAFILFTILKSLNLLRVSPEEEQAGLDLTEHGASAYTMLSGGD